jgi:hypothetical protein
MIPEAPQTVQELVKGEEPQFDYGAPVDINQASAGWGMPPDNVSAG